MPYTYLVGWRSMDVWYYGVRYAKDCDPTDLWKTYFTSSKRVAEFRATNGEPDVIEVRKTFDSPVEASDGRSAYLTGLVQFIPRCG